MDPQKDVTLTQYNLVSELTIWHLFIYFFFFYWLTWSLYLSLVSSLLELIYFLIFFYTIDCRSVSIFNSF